MGGGKSQNRDKRGRRRWWRKYTQEWSIINRLIGSVPSKACSGAPRLVTRPVPSATLPLYPDSSLPHAKASKKACDSLKNPNDSWLQLALHTLLQLQTVRPLLFTNRAMKENIIPTRQPPPCPPPPFICSLQSAATPRLFTDIEEELHIRS